MELTPVKRMSERLWGGFSSSALKELYDTVTDRASSPIQVLAAAECLASWHASHGNYESSHHYAVIARLASHESISDSTLLLEADALMMQGEPELGREQLAKRHVEGKFSPHILLALANGYASHAQSLGVEYDERRLALINEVYQRAELSELQLRNSNEPLSIENIVCHPITCSVAVSEQPCVTVLIPAYGAEAVLHIALESLIRQTWRNLEIIVVDDCSSDRTAEVAEDFAKRDARISVVRQSVNQGSYAARNRGLSLASGEYVTIHDTDDWSHPQKIELQMKAVLSEKSPVASLSNWVRCYRHLYFRPQSRVLPARVLLNSSSLLARRALLEELGGWDEVRIAADTELIKRIEHRFGRIARVARGVPLSFGMERPDSLTQQGTTHVNTRFHGVRRDYKESAAFWLARHPTNRTPRIERTESRPFPAPGAMLPERESKLDLDVMIVADFSQSQARVERVLDSLPAWNRQGLRVGIFHWPDYDCDVIRTLEPRVLLLLQENELQRVSAGDDVQVRTVLLLNEESMRHAIDRPPSLQCRRVAVFGLDDGPSHSGRVESSVVRVEILKFTQVEPERVLESDLEDWVLAASSQ